MSQKHIEALAEALGDILVAAGVVTGEAGMTGPQLICAAEDYESHLKSPKRNSTTIPAPSEETIGLVLRAFWRRIQPYKNDHPKELPAHLPVELKAPMLTAFMVLDRGVETIPTLDIDRILWEQVQTAAKNSPHVPKDYLLNDLAADLCGYLLREEPEETLEPTETNPWRDARTDPPPRETYVNALAPSGYQGHPWRSFTAQWDPDYKGWVTICNTRCTDYGQDIKWWKPLGIEPEVTP